MNAPGKTLLKVVSILFIIFGAIAAIASLLAIVGAAALSTMDIAGAALGGILLVLVLVSLAISVLDLVLGIVGLKKCGDPSKASYFITVGIILCVISLITLIMNASYDRFRITSLISFILPVLYIVGGVQNNRAAVEAAQQQPVEQQQFEQQQ